MIKKLFDLYEQEIFILSFLYSKNTKKQKIHYYLFVFCCSFYHAYKKNRQSKSFYEESNKIEELNSSTDENFFSLFLNDLKEDLFWSSIVKPPESFHSCGLVMYLFFIFVFIYLYISTFICFSACLFSYVPFLRNFLLKELKSLQNRAFFMTHLPLFVLFALFLLFFTTKVLCVYFESLFYNPL